MNILERLRMDEEMSSMNILAEIEKYAFVCGELMCIPTKKFYELVQRVNG